MGIPCENQVGALLSGNAIAEYGVLDNYEALENAVSSKGVFAFLKSLGSALEKHPEDTALSRLYSLLQIESHHLASWDHDEHPELLIQRLHAAAVRAGMEAQHELDAYLDAEYPHHLRLRWQRSQNQSNLLHTIRVSDDEVRSLAISPDGRLLATGSGELWGNDYVARVWDVESGDLIHELNGHEERVEAVAFSEDGSLLITGSVDHTAKVWDLETGLEKLTYSGHRERITCLTAIPGRRLVASGSWDKTVRVWEMDSGTEFASFEGNATGNEASSDYVLDLAVSPDGTRLVSASRDGSVHIFDLDTCQHLDTILGYTNAVGSLVVTADGRAISASGGKNPVRIADMTSGEIVQAGGDGRLAFGGVSALALTPDENMLIMGGNDGRVLLWDLSLAGDPIEVGTHADDVTEVVVSSDGKRVYSSSEDGTVKTWQIPSDCPKSAYPALTASVMCMEQALDGSIVSLAKGDPEADDMATWAHELEEFLHAHGAGFNLQTPAPPQRVQLLKCDGRSGEIQEYKTYRWRATQEEGFGQAGFGGLLRSMVFPHLPTGLWQSENNDEKLLMVPGSLITDGLVRGDHYQQREYSGRFAGTLRSLLGTIILDTTGPSFVALNLEACPADYPAPALLEMLSTRQSTLSLIPSRKHVLAFMQLVDSDGTILAEADWQTGDVKDYHLIAEGNQFTSPIAAVAVSVDGRFRAVGYGDSVELFDETSTDSRTFKNGVTVDSVFRAGEIARLQVLPCGAVIAVNEDGQVNWWVPLSLAQGLDGDEYSGLSRKLGTHHSLVAVAANGDWIAGAKGRTITIVDTLSAEPIAFYACEADVRCLMSGSANAHDVLYAGMKDGTVCAFDVRTGTEKKWNNFSATDKARSDATGIRNPIQQLIVDLGDEDVLVRLSASRALVDHGQEAVPYLLSAVRQGLVARNPHLVDFAGATLTNLCEAAIPSLVKSMLDENPDVRAILLRSIINMQAEAVAPLLAVVLEDDDTVAEDKALVEEALRILANLDLGAVRSLAREVTPRYCARVGTALGSLAQIGNRHIAEIDKFIDILDSECGPNEEVRREMGMIFFEFDETGWQIIGPRMADPRFPFHRSDSQELRWSVMRAGLELRHVLQVMMRDRVYYGDDTPYAFVSTGNTREMIGWAMAQGMRVEINSSGEPVLSGRMPYFIPENLSPLYKKLFASQAQRMETELDAHNE